MSNAMARIYFIPDYVTFTWCKKQEELFHIFLEDYATSVDEPVINIIEEAGVDLYDAIQALKEKGIFYVAQYSGDSRKMSGLYYLLSMFEVCKFQCGGGGKDDSVINLNTPSERTLEKLSLMMALNKMKGNENGR